MTVLQLLHHAVWSGIAALVMVCALIVIQKRDNVLFRKANADYKMPMRTKCAMGIIAISAIIAAAMFILYFCAAIYYGA